MPFKGIFARYNILSLFLILMGLWLFIPLVVAGMGLPFTMLLWGTSNLDAANGILLEPTAHELTDPNILFGFRIYTVFYGLGRLATVLVFLHLISGHPLTNMNARTRPTFGITIVAILVLLASIPLVSVAEAINQTLGLGAYLEEASEASMKIQQTLIAEPTVLEFGFNLLIFVVLASLWEEWIFRGLLQPMFALITRNAHGGIWLSAALFSAIHMQFDLFLPRLLLGALLGYLYYFGKTIWLPIIAHMFNNLYYILMQYLEDKGQINLPDEISNTLVIVSTLVFLVLFYALYRLSFHQTSLTRWRKTG